VLEEIELFVGAGGPEVLAVVDEVFLLVFASVVGEGHAALLAEGGIGKDVIEAFAGVGDEGVGGGDGAVAVDLADVVEEHVHQAEAAGIGDDFVAGEGLVFEEGFLGLVQTMVGDEVVVGGEEEAAGAAGRVGDGLAGERTDAFDHGFDQRARGEVLAGAGLGVLGVAFEQVFVDGAFSVGAEHDPIGFVHHGNDTGELGGVLDLVLGLGEDLAEHAGLFAELQEGLDVVGFEVGAVEGAESGPRVFGGDGDLAVVGRAAVFIRHFEEDEVGELLEVVAVADTVIAQGMAEGPDFGGDGVDGHQGKSFSQRSSHFLKRGQCALSSAMPISCRWRKPSIFR
jgi:hypothetical protein